VALKSIFEKLALYGLIPVIKIDDADDSIAVCDALIEGGLPVAEITFRTDAAEESIRQVASSRPDVLLGAGTVMTIEQAKQAKDAGAKYIVTASLNTKVVSWCMENDIPVLPGISSPSGIEQAISLGLDCVKFFPAEVLGGLKVLKALSGPYPKMRFVPTGGINLENLNTYLSNDRVLACGGSWTVPEEAISNKDFKKITSLTSEAIKKILGLQIAHIGINATDEVEAESTADIFGQIMDADPKKGNSSIFVTEGIEICKRKGKGVNGHIGIKTNSIVRAVHFLSEKGFEIDKTTYKRNQSGNIVAAYFEREIAGFAMHLLQKY
jgi:2-dehydro-3-deoxyphosphogluconate aldolase/(4S)-4-hydroxy-2-oxoglutarate aldolase